MFLNAAAASVKDESTESPVKYSPAVANKFAMFANELSAVIAVVKKSFATVLDESNPKFDNNAVTISASVPVYNAWNSGNNANDSAKLPLGFSVNHASNALIFLCYNKGKL